MKPRFHLLVRGVVFVDGHVLLAHEKGAGYTFLPGGHVEPGEAFAAALQRELLEELGSPCRVGSYLGAVEHEWQRSGVTHHEINHVFEAEVPDLRTAQPPTSSEPDLEFHWSSMHDLDRYKLQPHPLRELLRKWSLGDTSTWWATTVKV